MMVMMMRHVQLRNAIGCGFHGFATRYKSGREFSSPAHGRSRYNGIWRGFGLPKAVLHLLPELITFNLIDDGHITARSVRGRGDRNGERGGSGIGGGRVRGTGATHVHLLLSVWVDDGNGRLSWLSWWGSNGGGRLSVWLDNLGWVVLVKSRNSGRGSGTDLVRGVHGVGWEGLTGWEGVGHHRGLLGVYRRGWYHLVAYLLGWLLLLLGKY